MLKTLMETAMTTKILENGAERFVTAGGVAITRERLWPVGCISPDLSSQSSTWMWSTAAWGAAGFRGTSPVCAGGV